MRRQLQNVVGTVAKHQLIRRDTKAAGDGRFEFKAVAIRIAGQIIDRSQHRGLGLRADTKRILIGGKLDDVGLIQTELARDTLHIESRFDPAVIAELERRGHLIDRWGAFEELAGHAHGIVVDPQSGMRYGGSDPRSDGAAVGY